MSVRPIWKSGLPVWFRRLKSLSTAVFVVPADKLASIVRESFDDVIELEATESAVYLTGSDSRFTIYSHDPDQYPAVPGFEGDADLEVKLDLLQEGIEQTVFSAAKESTRYALNGILWEVHGKKTGAYCDRWAAIGQNNSGTGKECNTAGRAELSYRPRTMTLLDKIPMRDGGTVSIRFVDNQIVLACETVVVSFGRWSRATSRNMKILSQRIIQTN